MEFTAWKSKSAEIYDGFSLDDLEVADKSTISSTTLGQDMSVGIPVAQFYPMSTDQGGTLAETEFTAWKSPGQSAEARRSDASMYEGFPGGEMVVTDGPDLGEYVSVGRDSMVDQPDEHDGDFGFAPDIEPGPMARSVLPAEPDYRAQATSPTEAGFQARAEAFKLLGVANEALSAAQAAMYDAEYAAAAAAKALETARTTAAKPFTASTTEDDVRQLFTDVDAADKVGAAARKRAARSAELAAAAAASSPFSGIEYALPLSRELREKLPAFAGAHLWGAPDQGLKEVAELHRRAVAAAVQTQEHAEAAAQQLTNAQASSSKIPDVMPGLVKRTRLAPGARIIRGPDWLYAHDQDGGAGGLGTVANGLAPGTGLIKVRWDCNPTQELVYLCGRNEQCAIQLFDENPEGTPGLNDFLAEEGLTKSAPLVYTDAALIERLGEKGAAEAKKRIQRAKQFQVLLCCSAWTP